MYKDIYLENSDETIKMGKAIGKILKSGSFLCLHGDLGAGKTHLAKGIALGMGVSEPISSPTFTIVQEYKGAELEMLHFDVYRLSNSEELEFIGFDDYMKRKAVTLMEWAEIVQDIIPKNRVDICLRYAADGGRYIDIEVKDDNLKEVFKNLKF